MIKYECTERELWHLQRDKILILFFVAKQLPFLFHKPFYWISHGFLLWSRFFNHFFAFFLFPDLPLLICFGNSTGKLFLKLTKKVWFLKELVLISLHTNYNNVLPEWSKYYFKILSFHYSLFKHTTLNY